MLCFQGFADYHDKYKPVIKDDQVEAVQIYSKLLSFIERYKKKSTPDMELLLSLLCAFTVLSEVSFVDGF